MNQTTPDAPLRSRFGLLRQASVAIVAMLGLVVGGTIFGHLYNQRLANAARQAMESDAPQSVLACQITLQIAKCVQYQKEFEFCWNDVDRRERAVVHWQSSYEKLEGALDFIAGLEEPPAERQQLGMWREQSKIYRSRFLDVVHMVDRGRLADRGSVAKAIQGCQKIIEQMAADAEQLAADRTLAVQHSAAVFQQTIANRSRLLNVAAVVAVLSLILCILWFSRSVLARVRVLSEAMFRFATGDWEVRLSSDGDDELDLLARQFNDMVATIRSGNERLNKAREAAYNASRAKSEFLAGISEEIRGPITVSLGYADMLLGNLADTENLDAAGTVKRNNQYVLEVVEDVHDLAKIEAGRLHATMANCSPRTIVGEVFAATAVRAEAKGLTLCDEYEGPIPEQIRTDPERLRQLLVKLVDNAIKLTEIGTIRLVTRRVEDTENSPQLQFQVIDPGVGMTERQIARLFNPHLADDSNAESELAAINLKLAISKHLADMLRGTLGIDSTPGCGSTLTLTIPAVPISDRCRPKNSRAAEEPAAPAVSDAPIRLDCRILLAEDGRENRRLFSFILEKAGAKVDLVEDGQQAVERVFGAESADGRPDMILMDMQMPVLDGYDATRRLRQEGYDGPIIAVTGHTSDYDRQKCLDVGCDDYLAKPFQRQQLLEIVARHAPTSSAAEGDR